MPSKILSAALAGIDSKIVEVEVDISPGLPNFIIVGLPDAAVQEAKIRVHSAIKNSDFSFPRTFVAVNLAPADIKKEGPAYDLPIALGIIMAYEGDFLDIPLSSSVFIGELALNGSLRKVRGALAMAMTAREKGIKNIFLPSVNAAEASLIKGLNVYPVDSLKQLADYFNKKIKLEKYKAMPVKTESEHVNDFGYLSVRGQEYAKRALVICAAGGHNLFMSGPPGTGKTLLAKSIISILPSLEQEETLEVTKIYSVAGLVCSEDPLIRQRPFRSPHHSASMASLIGGGRMPKPGEISLAHRGVLFLDELPEFPRAVLESLRQPLEDGTVTVARVAGSLRFPSRFILITASNPCPCGYSSDPRQNCRCTPFQIARYQKRISGPLLDRMDLQIEVPRISFSELTEEKKEESDLESVREKIKNARNIQKERLRACGFRENSEMTNEEIKKFCETDAESMAILKQAVEKLALSARAYFRVLKVARTIADLEAEEKIKPEHVAEAIQYRVRK